MTDNPLGSLIQLCLLIFVLWSLLAIAFIVINHKLIASLHQENKELREALAKYQRANEPEWVRMLFDDTPSDPRMGVLN
jgi:hypothetical protein